MLRRIRIGFGLLAGVLVAALGFLILRTLDTLDRERELAHAAVANRVFDEAEEALADFLREEQARPAAAYQERPTGVAWMETQPPFVEAYFEIDRRGRIRSSASRPEFDAELRGALASARAPRLERSAAEPARNATTTAPAASHQAKRDKELRTEQASTIVEEQIAAFEADDLLRLDDRDGLAKKQAAPSPGTARNLQSIDLITGRAKAGGATSVEAKAEEASAYSSNRALATLGRIAKDTAREEAVPKLRQEEQAASPPLRKTRASLAYAAPSPTPADVREAEGFADPDRSANVAPEAPAAAPAPTADPVPLALAPSRLSVEPLDDERLLLYRTALDDTGRAVQQGMLVEVDALGDWLTRRVLGESELRNSLTLQLKTASAEPAQSLPSELYVYAYRFVAPFESLSLRLGISPLDDGGNARNIGWLSLLLVVASTLGLYAVYRMASVAVHFAERRSNFAAAVSHELKTPLTAIRMYGEMLRDGMVQDESKRHEYYSTITTESERLTRLINNVLEWSKLEKHQREACLEVGDVTSDLRDVIEIVSPHAAAEGFEIELRLPQELPPARHDSDALQQILYNLIDNAIKYAQGHDPTRIEVVAEAVENGLSIRVRDHGPGVRPESLPLVFEAFYRAEGELTRQTRGTGIGLALSRGLAESMNGRLTARNHPDGGLEVELRLHSA